MQILKNFFVICAITSLVTAPGLSARETDAQAKAREELRKKMAELDAQEKGARAPAPAPQTQPPPPVTAPAPTQPAPVEPVPVQPATAQPVAVQPVPVPVTGDDEATARARAAMREKMRELDTQNASTRAPAPSAPPAEVIAPAPAPQPVAPVATPAPAPVTAAAPVATPVTRSMFAPTGQPEDQATVLTRAALRQKMAELDAQERGGKPASAYAGAVASQTEFKPIAAPPLPISGPKEMRLAELLRQYKADQITPNVYHKERAKILAEP